MTINKLHKLLSEMIANGHGRKLVCIDKSKVNHVLESDGVIVIPATSAEINTHEMIGDDGGMKELANGCVATRTHLVIAAELGTPSEDQPLNCQVEGNRLVISIGLKTLAFAAEHQDENPSLKVINEKELGEDVCRVLKHEDEIGQSLLTHLFDSATTKACENGSAAFDHEQPVPER